MEVGLGEKQSCQTLTGKPMANAARCKVNQIDIISKHPREKHALFNDWTHSSKFFFVKTEVPKVHAAFSKSYVHWGFIQYGWFLSTLKSSKLSFGFVYMLDMLPFHNCSCRKCTPTMPNISMDAMCLYGYQKINRKINRFVLLTHRPMWPAFAT